MYDIPNWVVTDLYSVALIIFVLIATVTTQSPYKRQQKFLSAVMVTVLINVSGDLISKITPITDKTYFFIETANMITYIGDPIACVLTLYYINSWITGKMKHENRWLFIPNVFAITNGILVLYSRISGMNIFYGYAHENGIYTYQRGEYFIIRAAIMIFMYIIAEADIIVHIKKMPVIYQYPMLVFPFIPIFFGLMQTLFYGCAWEYVGVTISFIIMFYHGISRDIEEDGLTKAFIRKRIFEILDDKIDISKNGKHGFSGIMADIDNFKEINDTYGHEMGDQVLINVSEYLMHAFHSRTYVGRYGGDEFLILVDIENEEILECEIGKVMTRFNKANSFRKIPFSVGISMGYRVYNNISSPKEFINSLDQHMYNTKEIHHNCKEEK